MDDILGNLIEAIRKGHVLRLSDRSPMSPVKNTDHWALTSYDFGGLLHDDSPEYVGVEIERNAASGIKAGPFIGPERPFIVILRGARTGQILITRFGEDHLAEVYVRTLVGGRLVWVVDDTNFAANGFRSLDPALMAIWLLANRQTRYEMATETPMRQSINAGRLQGGRKQLPPVQIIHLTKVEKIDPFAARRAHQGGTHASPRPHDRASDGYSRTYKKTGLTKWYPGPIKVRGGAEAAGAVRYEVRQ
jgi:hypothetical protein